MTWRHFALPLALSPLLLLAGVAVVLLPGTMTLVVFAGTFFFMLAAVLRSFMKALAEVVPPEE